VCEGINSLTAVAQPWRHVIEISKRTRDLGNDVQVLSDRQEGCNGNEEIEGIPIQRIRKNGFLFDVEELQESINQEDFDIINWHGSDTWSSINLWRLRKRVKKNIVWTLHSGPLSVKDFKNLGARESICLYKNWNSLLNAVFPTFVIRKWTSVPQLKHIIVPSRRVSKHLESMGIAKEKIGVIPSGVDTHLFSSPDNQRMEQLKQNLGFDKNERLILYFGPLSTFRGIDTLIAAMPIIRKEIQNARLVVMGRVQKSENEKWVRRAVDLGKFTPVMGILEREMVIAYLSIADVVVLPFKFWPQVEIPLTVLESMSMGKPLITTSTGTISEIIQDGENGILVSPKDSKGIAEKVILLLKDDNLTLKIGKNARRHVENFFDWNIIVQQTLSVFNQVANNQFC
jgi:glycosyltransferase involved in cell wall biosynthesis